MPVDIQAREDEVASFLSRWFQSMITGDRGGTAGLREESYVLALSNELELSAAEELDMLSSSLVRFSAPDVARIDLDPGGGEAKVHYSLEVEYPGEAPARQPGLLLLARSHGSWRARWSRLGGMATDPDPRHKPPGALAGLVPRPVRRWLARVRGVGRAHSAAVRGPAYLPYKAGSDYVVEAGDIAPPRAPGDPLPIPPESLWLGYHYPMHGKAQVETMLDIVGASGFSLRPGDRVLDLGCGAGRMIRHLRHLADSCEIWGADIAAEPILWCKHNLSPPFRFLTNTKTPHLPFEDRSFRLIYCASLFTHIDELADGWLLELHRLLEEDGRLYVTIHDKHSVELFEDRRYAPAKMVQRIKSYPLFRQAAPDFQVLAVGRAVNPHIFYDVDYFAKMAGGAFDILSVTPEAYFYQTAVLLKRRASP